jgi:MFS family permease
MPPQREEGNSLSVSMQEPLLSHREESLVNESISPPNDSTSSSHARIINKDIVIPAHCCRRCLVGNSSNDGGAEEEEQEAEIRVNYNVALNLVLAVVYGISGSLWNGTAYAAYLKKLGQNRNAPLGDIEAVQGMASLLAALPMGFVADKIGRSKVIRAGGVLLLLTTIAQVFVLEWVGTDEDGENGEDGRSYNTTAALWIMGVIMAFWGIGDGVVNGPCMALFADSTPEGERSIYFNYLFVCYMAASACGPLVSIVLFQTLGDDWDLYHLRIVIYVGLGVELMNSCLLMLFDDNKALDESDSRVDDESSADDDGCSDDINAVTETVNGNISVAEVARDGSSSGNSGQSTPDSDLTPLQKRQKWIPYIVFSQGLIFAVGSGMTVKFFPLFFKDEVGMSPSQVQMIYCIVPFVMAICSTLCTKLASSGLGRVQTMLLFSVVGIFLLYAMVFFKSYLDVHPFLLVPVYVLRTSLMNASYPIQESILMDFVPKDERARWKSLDSVASFGWCGSAALGGWLADKFDYTYTFLITAITQTVGLGVWCLLLPLVPRKEGSHGMNETQEVVEEEDSNDQSHDADLDDGFSSRAQEDVVAMERELGVNTMALDNNTMVEPLLSS